MLTDTPITAVVERLRGCGVEIVAGHARRAGATGPLLSEYFYDPDENLIEVSNSLDV